MKQLSITHYWIEKYKGYMPVCSYEKRVDSFEVWKRKSKEKLLELLGDFPEHIPLISIEESKVLKDGLVIERRYMNTEPYMTMPFIVMYKEELAGDKMPAILCIHGHAAYAKEEICGLVEDKSYAIKSKMKNENYAELMARQGFITLTPDLRGFGERSGEGYLDRDSCNVNFIKGALMGEYLFTLNIWDLMCCVEYLKQREDVKPDCIGAMGLSYGGTLTTFLTAIVEDIVAADIIGYLNPFQGFAIERGNFCGAQMVPHLYKYFDTHDVASLIAPRPLLIEMGINDDTFFYDDMLRSYERVRRCYDDLGIDTLHKDTHEGKHQFAANKAYKFFEKYLKNKGGCYE